MAWPPFTPQLSSIHRLLHTGWERQVFQLFPSTPSTGASSKRSHRQHHFLVQKLQKNNSSSIGQWKQSDHLMLLCPTWWSAISSAASAGLQRPAKILMTLSAAVCSASPTQHSQEPGLDQDLKTPSKHNAYLSQTVVKCLLNAGNEWLFPFICFFNLLF